MVGRAARAAFAIGLAASTALALWVVWPAFSPGRIVNLDAPRHLLRTVVMAQQFLPSGHVDGWSPWWYLGAQLFLFQSYGWFLLVGGAALVLAPWVSLETVFKAFYVLPVVALPAATAFLARRLGVPARGAVAAAVASLAFSSPQGFGIQGVFGIGLLLQGAGILGFAVAWPEALAVLLDRRRSPWPAVLLLAAVLVGHFITGAYALAAIGVVAAGLALRDRDAAPLLRYAAMAALVLLLAGHSLFPALEMRDLSGSAVGWGADRDRFWRVMAGTLFGVQPLALAAIAAAAWSARTAERPLAITAMAFFGTALLGGMNPAPWEPEPIAKLLDTLVRPRALPYAALFQCVFAGVAVDALLRLAALAARPLLRVGAAAVVVAAFAWLTVPEIASLRRFVRTESVLGGPQREVYLALVDWLRANVDAPAIVALPRTLLPNAATGARSCISLLNLDTGLYTLGGDQAELQKTSRSPGRVDIDRIEREPARAAGKLRASGVSYVIVSRYAHRRLLAANSQYELVFERSAGKGVGAGRRGGSPRQALTVSVFRVRDGGSWLNGRGVTVRRMKHEPERILWDVAVTGSGSAYPVEAAVNWHPNWTVLVDGREVPPRMTPTRRVAFDVPSGSSRVELVFERGLREKLYNWLSAGTLLAVLAAMVRRGRRRAHGTGAPAGAPNPQETLP